MGVSASLEKGAIDDAAKDLAQITGRKPVISKSRKSIANFKLRENVPIGCRVTLRRDAMYEFFDRLVAVTLPRIRDFRGLRRAHSTGVEIIRWESPTRRCSRKLNWIRLNGSRGMDITIVTSAQNDEEARELLKLMGMPFAEGK